MGKLNRSQHDAIVSCGCCGKQQLYDAFKLRKDRGLTEQHWTGVWLDITAVKHWIALHVINLIVIIAKQ